MKRLLTAGWTVLSSRALPPLVCGVFLLVYIGIAFVTDDTLIALMEFTRKSVILALLLALIPLNSLCRLVMETARHRDRLRAMSGNGGVPPEGLFDESVLLEAVPDFAGLQERLETEGYGCRRSGSVLSARRGFGIFPARFLFLAGSFCLFAGILISLTTRTSHRMLVVEGEPIPTAKGGGGVVERISLKPSTGAILDKVLTLEVAPSEFGDAAGKFGLYPPSLYRGNFVYPRYLGISPLIRFSAPDLPVPFEKQLPLYIYPPGKEDRVEIPGSPYQLLFTLAKPADGSDPYMAGAFAIRFKLLKGKEELLSGSVPVGGEFVSGGYRLALPDCRRTVLTDFIRDYGVLLVWTAAVLFLSACFLGIPARAFSPRREMLFASVDDGILACSRAEGGRRRHGGVFHEALDLLVARTPASPGASEAPEAPEESSPGAEGRRP